MDLLDGMMTLRAIRRYSDEPVTEDEIRTCLRAAQQAPSGGNIQPWQFVVVRNAEAKRAIGAIYREAYERYEPAMLKVAPAPKEEPGASAHARTITSARYLARHIGEAPALVAFCVPNISMTLRDEQGEMDTGNVLASVYPAVQNFMLAARSLGIGTALTTVYRIYQQRVRDVIGVPERYEIVALVPMGRPRGSFGVAPRRPYEGVTHWDRWGNKG